MSDVPPEILAWRHRTGADRYDEVWGGVLHMALSPGPEHQLVLSRLLGFLMSAWEDRPRRVASLGTNVAPVGAADWTRDFRVPDLMLITDRSRHVDRGTHLEGAPDVVVEIRSPGDESDAKVAFYAAAGCREVWIVDRDTRACVLHVVGAGRVRRRRPDRDGWLRSALGVELRQLEGRLELRLTADHGVRGAVP